MSSRYFITGTGTDVGKTVASTVLSIGLKARYWKPIQTGSSAGTDSSFLASWIGERSVIPETYVFHEPVSPHIAAKNNGVEIDLDRCLNDFEKIEGPLIVEGAGGVMVPINSTTMMLDFINKLSLPTVIVTNTKLGAINHTLLTIEALVSRGVEVAGVITVGEKNPSYEETILRFGSTKILGNIPVCEEFSRNWFQAAFGQLLMSLNQGVSVC